MECFVASGGVVGCDGGRRMMCEKKGRSVTVAGALRVRMMAAVDEAQVDTAELAPLNMYVRNKMVQEAVASNRLHDKDSGSPEAQISKLSVKIQMLTEHAKQNPKDHSSTRGLIAMVSQRKKLLKYLRKEDPKRFDAIVSSMNIRISQQMLAKY